MPLEMPLGAQIRLLRMRQRLTLKDVSDRVGVSLGVVNHWEGKRTQVPAELVPDIARALGVTICELYGVKERHPAPPQSGLTSAERQILDNIARDLVKLRSEQPRPARGRAESVSVPGAAPEIGHAPAQFEIPGRETPEFEPSPGDRFTKRVLQALPTMGEEDRRDLYREVTELAALLSRDQEDRSRE